MRTVRSVLGYGYFMVFFPFVFIVLDAAGRAQRGTGRAGGAGARWRANAPPTRPRQPGNRAKAAAFFGFFELLKEQMFVFGFKKMVLLSLF